MRHFRDRFNKQIRNTWKAKQVRSTGDHIMQGYQYLLLYEYVCSMYAGVATSRSARHAPPEGTSSILHRHLTNPAGAHWDFICRNVNWINTIIYDIANIA